MAKVGRRAIEIDREEFEKLCGIMCTREEIAGWFHVSVNTVENWCKRTYGKTFSQSWDVYSQAGKISLRRAQFKLAMTNANMAIFLGKQYLGQSDILQANATFEDLTPLAELIK